MREPKKLSTRIFSRSKYDICLSNVGGQCAGIFKLQMVGSLFPPHTRSEMMEIRTPHTAIFNPLWVCLEGVRDDQEADILFVFARLYSSGIFGVAAIASLWNRYNSYLLDWNGCFLSGGSRDQ